MVRVILGKRLSSCLHITESTDSIRQRIEELPLTKITPSDEWADFIIFTRISISARFQPSANLRGGSSISGKGAYLYKGVGVRITEFLLFFLNIP